MEHIYDVVGLARVDNFRTIQKIFKKYPLHTVDTPDNLGRTAFMYSAKNNNLLLMKYLMDLGANIEAEDKFNMNALQLAIQNDSEDTAKYLIEIGMDPNIYYSIDNNSLLHLAILNDNLKIAKLLVEYGANPLVENYRNYDAYQEAQACFDSDDLKEFKKILKKNGYTV